MLNILYILSSTNTTGGASKSFINMLHHLSEEGIEATIVVPDREGLYQDFKEKGIRTEAILYRMAVYPPCKSFKDMLLWIPRLCGRILVNCLAIWSVQQLCKQIHPDIIHTNVSVIDIGFRAAQHLHIPHVWHIREYGDLDFHLYHYPSRRYQLKHYTANNSYTICITRDIQRHNKLEKWPHSRVIYNGILTRHDIPSTIAKEPFLLFAGRIEPAKGLRELLCAYIHYTKVAQNSLPLYIVGAVCDKKYFNELQDLIGISDIKDKILFAGEQKDIDSWEKRATAVIIPSLNEGFGRVMPEAMYNRTLVIAHNTAGTKEQLENGRLLTGNDIALHYETEDELVQHLINVTDTPQEKFAQIIENAYTIVARLYTTEQNAQQVYQFYQEICSKNS